MQPGPQDSPVTPPAGDSAVSEGSTDRREGPSSGELAPLHPRVRVLWGLTGGLFVVQIGLVVGLVDSLVSLPWPRGALTAAVTGVAGLLALVVPVLRYRRWRYALRDTDLWIRRGVLWVTVSVIPFSRLQFVDTRQGPLDRLFGLSQLVVHTAALGTSGRLPGLASAEAERLRERLAAVEPSDDVSV